MNKISGVYKITNTITGDFYIGSSNDINKCWIYHKCPSHWARQPGIKLYQAFIEYGKDNFLFEVIEETAELKKREQYFIDVLKPNYNSVRADGVDIEKRRKYRKEYYESHIEEQQAYRKSHQDELKAYKQEWYAAHREDDLARKKVWYESHKEERQVYYKSWYESHKEAQQSKSRDYYNRLCSYNGKTLTLNNLSQIFRRQGIPHPVLEAKKFLIEVN